MRDHLKGRVAEALVESTFRRAEYQVARLGAREPSPATRPGRQRGVLARLPEVEARLNRREDRVGDGEDWLRKRQVGDKSRLSTATRVDQRVELMAGSTGFEPATSGLTEESIAVGAYWPALGAA